jgi:hypothetical protein
MLPVQRPFTAAGSAEPVPCNGLAAGSCIGHPPPAFLQAFPLAPLPLVASGEVNATANSKRMQLASGAHSHS